MTNNWPEIRDAYLAEHPYCEICGARGWRETTAHAHHLVLKGRRGASNAKGNLLALCRECHRKCHNGPETILWQLAAIGAKHFYGMKKKYGRKDDGD